MSNWGVAAWYLVRDVECLTQTRKRLILLAFVSYEAVRLWWRGGSNGVVDFEKTPCICSIPTLASNLKPACFSGFWRTDERTVSKIVSKQTDDATTPAPYRQKGLRQF